MSQLSFNELLRKGDKSGWIKKRREAMKCTANDLEEAWKRHRKKHKQLIASEKTKGQRVLVDRATGNVKGLRFQTSRAFLEKGKPNQKSSLSNPRSSYEERKESTPLENARSMKKKGGKRRKTRKRKTRKKTKRRRKRKKKTRRR